MNKNEHLESKGITAGLMSDRLIKIKVGEIRDAWTYTTDVSVIRRIRRAWKKTTTPKRLLRIKKSILKFGYDPEKFGYIAVNKKYADGKPYRAVDGNHRVRVLRELYGEDYEVTVSDVSSYFTDDDSVNRPISTMGKLKEGLTHLPIMYYPSFVFFIWNMLLEVMLFSLFCFFTLMLVRDRSQDRFIDTHPKKGLVWVYNKSTLLYEIIMNIYYNSRHIILGIAFLYYVYYIISNYFYGLLIVGGITILIMVIFKFLGLSVILNLKDTIKKIKNI